MADILGNQSTRVPLKECNDAKDLHKRYKTNTNAPDTEGYHPILYGVLLNDI